jgi:hypothetical protein
VKARIDAKTVLPDGNPHTPGDYRHEPLIAPLPERQSLALAYRRVIVLHLALIVASPISKGSPNDGKS